MGKTRQKQVLGEDVCVEMTNSVFSEAVDGYPKGRCPIDSGTVGQ